MTNQQRRQGGSGGGGNTGSGENKDNAVAINSLHATYKSTSNKAEEYGGKQFKWAKRATITAIAYTVITSMLLAAGIWSAIQAQNAVGVASSALGEAKRAADAATKSADAAQAQVAATKDTEQKQLMAYVGVAQHGIENFGAENQVVKVTRKNYGTTPAIDLIMSPVASLVVEAGKPFNFPPIICVPAPALQNSFAIFPTQEVTFEYRGLDPRISKEQIEQVKSGTYMIMYWGAAFYKDIFGAQHCTRFCWSFQGQSMGERDATLCAQHNDTH